MKRVDFSSAAGFWCALLLAAVCVSPRSLYGQAFYGSIVGTVADTSGAVVPGAKVTVTNKSTNETHAGTSSSAGEFSFVDLVPAVYSVQVEGTGFKRYVRDNVAVEVNSTTRVNASMEVGAVTETVEVSTAGVQLQTDSPTVSNKVEAQQMDELPLNGRNVMQLLNITAGVIPSSAVEQGATLAQNNGTSSNPLSWGGGSGIYTINGGDNEEYIDGAPINMLQGSNIGLMPTADAIQEFNIDTSVGDSQEGRATGGVINETTKSGTNKLHWTAYDYFRNADLNANNFFNKRNGLGTPKQNQNLWGFNFGFPIRRDKIFFFGSFEQDNVVGAAATLLNMPTNGNAASQPGLPGGGTDIWDGIFTRQIADPTGNCPSVTGTQLAPGNNVKAIVHDTALKTWSLGGGCWDPTSAIMRTFFANTPNTASNVFNFSENVPVGNTAPEMNVRVDWDVSSKQRVFTHVAWWAPHDKPFVPFFQPNVPSALPGGKPWNFGSAVGGFASNLYILGDTYTFNPKTVFDIRAEWLRFRYSMIPAVNNFDRSQLGPNWAQFTALTKPGQNYIPAPTFNGGNAVHNLAPANIGFSNGAASGTFGPGGQSQLWDNYGLNGTITRLFGKHSVKIGFEAREMDMEVLYGSWNGGAPSFGDKYSSLGCTGSNCGDEWADFLMGYFTSINLGGSYGGTEFNYYQAYFVSDQWQVSRNLTLNLGVRWELPGGLEEKKDSTFVFLPYTTDPNTGTKGTEVLVNSAAYPSRSIFPIKHNLVDPRVGFAYRLGDKTVVRGGFGLTTQAVDQDGGGNGAPGVAINSDQLQWTNPNGAAPTATLSNPVPSINNVYVPRLGRTPNFLQQFALGSQITGGTSLNGYYSGEPLAYFEQYNFAAQRQIGSRFTATASYVGSQGVKLKAGGPIDEIPASAYSVTTTGTQAASSAGNLVPSQTATAATGPYAGTNLTANVPTGGTIHLLGGPSVTYPTGTVTFANGVFCSPNGAYCNNNVKVGRTLQPYPNYSNATIGNLAYGHQTYNALQVTSQYRIQGGGLFGLAYTWAKTMNDVSNYQDYNNHRGDRTVAGVPMRLVFNVNYPLPIGQGQRFLNGNNFGSRLISGWTINDITSFQHGGYLTLTTNTQNQLQQNFGAGTTRPNYIPGGYTVINGTTYNCNSQKTVPGSAVSRLNEWFNVGCFQYPGDYSFGNERANDSQLFAQGIHNWDLALLKTTKLTERMNIQFRLETFNTFNRFQAAPPNTAVGNGSFGIVTSQANNPRQVQLMLRLNY